MSLGGLMTMVDATMKNDVNCILLMGGTTNGIPKKALKNLVETLYKRYGISVCLFSGLPEEETDMKELARWYGLDYLKTGDYREDLGGIESPKSNQKFYRKDFNHTIDSTGLLKIHYYWDDITYKFRSKEC